MTVNQVADEYKYLYHYTTAHGLYGIIKSQQLWATHISYLNDAEEQIGFFDRRLDRLLKSSVSEGVEKLYKTENGMKDINELGGVESAANQMLRDLYGSLREVTLTFNQPYITSFCASKLFSDDGILSQWRGYGHDGGYAIVFDVMELGKLLHIENENFIYQSAHWGDVQYHVTNMESLLPETAEWESKLSSVIRDFILDPRQEVLEPLLEVLTPLSCFHKHGGFVEENEVRIVALPAHGDLLTEIQKTDQGKRKPKTIKFNVKNGMLVPYISLFEVMNNDEPLNLPISKIIVGPHPEKLKRKKSIELLLKEFDIDVEVVTSDIPYLGK